MGAFAPSLTLRALRDSSETVFDLIRSILSLVECPKVPVNPQRETIP